MNEQQYRKQLVIQQIDGQRAKVRFELQRVKDLNPIQPYIDLGHKVLGIASSIREGGHSAGHALATSPIPLSLGGIITFVIQIATSLFSRRRGRKKRK